jgi:hypothetical protein
LAEANKVAKVFGDRLFARNKREMRRVLRRLNGRKRTSVDFLD